MSLKNILVHVDASERAGERIRVAASLAGADDGHLTGVFVAPDPLIPTWMVAGMPASTLEAAVERVHGEGDAARERFQEIADRAGVHAEWRMASGSVSHVTALHARYADLAVVGKGSASEPELYPYPDLAADLTMSCGRPVLVVPNSGRFDVLGENVLVCWNASREATRAVNDAMPFLRRAEKVVVLSVNAHRPSGGDHGENSERRYRAASGAARRERRSRKYRRRRHCRLGHRALACERPRHRPDRHRRLGAFPDAGMGLRRRDGLAAARHDGARPDVALNSGPAASINNAEQDDVRQGERQWHYP